MLITLNIILIGISLSMDAFVLAMAYGITNIGKTKSFITAFIVGISHFIMPYVGNIIGISLFEYTIIKPKLVLFLIFLILSIDMFVHFFEETPKIRKLNVIGIILFALSVSFDSFSVGLGINYICDNVIISFFTFSIISFLFTMLGFYLGRKISSKTGKNSFLFGSITLLIYSLIVLTK